MLPLNMKSILLPSGEETIVDDDVYEEVGHLAWHKSGSGYVAVTLGPRNKKVRFYLHRYITKCPIGLVVDHLNKNKLDNTRQNLKVCTRNVNGHGSGRNPKSGFVGVKRAHQKKVAWVAQIHTNGKTTHLGTFTNIVEAAIAYDTEAIKRYGEHAKCNILSPNRKID